MSICSEYTAKLFQTGATFYCVFAFIADTADGSFCCRDPPFQENSRFKANKVKSRSGIVNFSTAQHTAANHKVLSYTMLDVISFALYLLLR